LNHSVWRLARRSTRKVAKVDVVHRPSGLTKWAPAGRKPGGPGRFGPNPSAFSIGRTTGTTSLNPSTLSHTTAGRMFQSNLISL